MDDSVPVAVHGWFLDGDGWAYGPGWEDCFHDATIAVNSLLSTETVNRETFVLPFHRGSLIGEKFPDKNPIDPKAAGRIPFVLRMGYLRNRKPNEAIVDRVLEGLETIPLPTEKGHCDSLRLLPATPHDLRADSLPLRGASRGTRPDRSAVTVATVSRSAPKQQSKPNAPPIVVDSELSTSIKSLQLDVGQLVRDMATLRSELQSVVDERSRARRALGWANTIFKILAILALAWVGVRLLGSPPIQEFAIVLALGGLALVGFSATAFAEWYWAEETKSKRRDIRGERGHLGERGHSGLRE